MAQSLLSLEAIRDRLFPMLLPPKRVESLGEGHMVARLLAEDLAVVYVEDVGPNEIRYVTWEELQAWGIGPDGLHQIALWNLDEKSRPLFPIVMNPPGKRDPMFIWNVQDGYDAARILLHRWLAEAASQVDGRLLLAVPDRHWLAATGDRDPQKRAAFHRLTRERFQTTIFPVSPHVYVWTGHRLVVDRLE
ncbi:DUF1444 family protein [Caldinitratiruptor microaerophilus]|uniref:DUF1444 family protein n=1 Tax=Caldinitratiruptor microaerophilus TaxID=671077 RepID=A0AA35GBL7_9FIRM|nr:DUF1444 family protein [Caldinitratiruptor microaerophilus]BDG62449.1 hypothetical protein caldi_35390 [Caldinitratiruptor microaerophilus]